MKKYLEKLVKKCFSLFFQSISYVKSCLTVFAPNIMVRATLGHPKELIRVEHYMAGLNNNKQSDNETPISETDSLAERIARAKSKRVGQEAAQRIRRNEMTGAGRAFRMVSEFISAIIVGAVIGLTLDAVFSTRPIFLIVLLLLGFAAGVLNVVRATAQINAATPLPDPKDLVPVDKDDED